MERHSLGEIDVADPLGRERPPQGSVLVTPDDPAAACAPPCCRYLAPDWTDGIKRFEVDRTVRMPC
ncbi:hypothetical protein [Actinoallomurus acaciae]|uniref:Uncharacterized protein n=1 Tax=Actinoallomurus acaciae TaxID=502577 RepID=A0ABV5YIA6_9ACTN